MRDSVEIGIDGKRFTVPAGVSVKDAARLAGVYVPGLCSHPDLESFRPLTWSEAVWQGEVRMVAQPRPTPPHRSIEGGELTTGSPSIEEGEGVSPPTSVGGDERGGDLTFHCNLCLVSLNGGVAQRACDVGVVDGMQVRATGDDLVRARREGLKSILGHHPHICLTCAQREGCDRVQCSMNVPIPERCCELFGRCEIGKVADFVGIPADTPAYNPMGRPVLQGEPLFIRDFELCIGCTRCVRICRDVRGVDALGAIVQDGLVRVGTTGGASLPESDCRFCGACVEVCPTGALRDKAGCEPLVNGQAPCTAACPLGIDVPGYLGFIGRGLEFEALELIRERAVLPGVLGYACFHPCEEHCRRRDLDAPAAICALKRYVADAAGDRPPQVVKAPPTGRQVAVVGSGPAGLAAAAELLRQGHAVTLFERASRLGGMLRQTLPDYRLPDAVLDRDLAYLDALGMESRLGVDLGRDIALDQLRADFDAVLLAMGLPSSMGLNVEGEELRGIHSGLDFLGKAATGDAAKLTGPVVVIGGGNAAMDAARVARRLGADQVMLVCLESPEEMPAFREEVAEAVAEGIEMRHRWGVLRFEGGNDRVSSVMLQRCTRIFDAQKRFKPEYDPSQIEIIAADAVIVAIGQRPDAGMKPAERLPEGIFVAGDAVTGPSSIVEAMADGRRAAERVSAFFEVRKCESAKVRKWGVKGSVEIGINGKSSPGWLGKDPYFHQRERTVPKRLAPEERVKSLLPYEATFSREQARNEAARCLRCQLRAQITPSPLPPDPWAKFDDEALSLIPAVEGVLILADAGKKVVNIAGAADLKKALTDALSDGISAAFCRWELDPMFTKRESELLQAHLKAFGGLPGGGDLDDLF